MTTPTPPARPMAFPASQIVVIHHRTDRLDLTREDVLDSVANLRHLATCLPHPVSLLADWWHDEGHTGVPRPNGWLAQVHHIQSDQASNDWHAAAIALMRLGASLPDPATVLPLLGTGLPDGAILIAAAALTHKEALAVASGVTPVDLPAWSTLAALAGYRLPHPDATGTAPQT